MYIFRGAKTSRSCTGMSTGTGEGNLLDGVCRQRQHNKVSFLRDVVLEIFAVFSILTHIKTGKNPILDSY